MHFNWLQLLDDLIEVLSDILGFLFDQSYLISESRELFRKIFNNHRMYILHSLLNPTLLPSDNSPQIFLFGVEVIAFLLSCELPFLQLFFEGVYFIILEFYLVSLIYYYLFLIFEILLKYGVDFSEIGDLLELF
jgi:hypothetical protein